MHLYVVKVPFGFSLRHFIEHFHGVESMMVTPSSAAAAMSGNHACRYQNSTDLTSKLGSHHLSLLSPCHAHAEVPTWRRRSPHQLREEEEGRDALHGGRTGWKKGAALSTASLDAARRGDASLEAALRGDTLTARRTVPLELPHLLRATPSPSGDARADDDG